jgi:hypothetical protein
MAGLSQRRHCVAVQPPYAKRERVALHGHQYRRLRSDPARVSRLLFADSQEALMRHEPVAADLGRLVAQQAASARPSPVQSFDPAGC